jgi:hypothetical protein
MLGATEDHRFYTACIDNGSTQRWALRKRRSTSCGDVIGKEGYACVCACIKRTSLIRTYKCLQPANVASTWP